MKDLWESPYPAPAELFLERPLTDVPGGETRQAQPRGAQPVARNVLPCGKEHGVRYES